MTGRPDGAIGVVGAGTMGAGIAQLACLAEFDTILHDPYPEALERGRSSVLRGLKRGAERGRHSADQAMSAGARLLPAASLDALRDCVIVIEAAPERLDLKTAIVEELAALLAADAVIASNTSSILISSLAGAATNPGRVLGMHFFNPPPAMRLLELIATAVTDERSISLARGLGEAMGKRVIVAQDGPGFLVNRCGRPFGSEALRLLQERVASHAAIDRICRLGGGFRMGPFELMDLVGIDVGLEVAQSFDRQSFGEPRWRPNPLQTRKVALGELGRKSGRGWYEYGGEGHRLADPRALEPGGGEGHRPADPPALEPGGGEGHRPADPPALEPGGGEGRTIAVLGSWPIAVALRRRAEEAGFDVRQTVEGVELIIDTSMASVGSGPPRAMLCARTSLAAGGAPAACGFNLLPPLDCASLVELTRLETTPEPVAAATEGFFAAIGLRAEWVADAPGLVLGRIVCQLVNEAAFALGEGIGSPEDIDRGLELGLNHPRGPLAWAREIGLEQVLATIDGLWEERREERYRAAPLLRRAVALERSCL